MNELPASDDEVINVKLTMRDYRLLKEMLDDAKAMRGFRKISNRWLTKLFWIAGGALTLFGVYDILKRIGG